MGASLTQSHAHFFSGCDFMVGLGKPKLCTKFEVPSFSHCVNIEVEPQNFGQVQLPITTTPPSQLITWCVAYVILLRCLPRRSRIFCCRWNNFSTSLSNFISSSTLSPSHLWSSIVDWLLTLWWSRTISSSSNQPVVIVIAETYK